MLIVGASGDGAGSVRPYFDLGLAVRGNRCFLQKTFQQGRGAVVKVWGNNSKCSNVAEPLREGTERSSTRCRLVSPEPANLEPRSRWARQAPQPGRYHVAVYLGNVQQIS